MKKISGNIYNIEKEDFIKGHIYFNNSIYKIEIDESINETSFIIPGLIDSHIHIESSMLTPFEYSKIALKHGVIGAITDPHEIANVCGVEGIQYMIKNSESTPMKIFTGVPSCVPATNFETTGAKISSDDIEYFLKSGKCSHLSEMMNFPGVIYKDPEVLEKIQVAKKYNKRIDGHAPLLTGDALKSYIKAGISSDHESSSIEEAHEKILSGIKILIRESTASHGFDCMEELISSNSDSIMFCTDDCHPDDLEKKYIDDLIRRGIKKGHLIQNLIKAATINPVLHYNLNIGLLRVNDQADFIKVDNLIDFNILKVFIDGEEVFDGKNVKCNNKSDSFINNFYINKISESDLKIKKTGELINVIHAKEDSLMTEKFVFMNNSNKKFLETDISNDILKIVVLNRYNKAKPSVGFIKGFGLKNGSIGSTVAHDSHNIIVVGTDDISIFKAIKLIQKNKGGMVLVCNDEEQILPLPIAGLMSELPAADVARKYQSLKNEVFNMGCTLVNPFITLSFMALLVIPELKISDQGLFDVNQFKIIDLQK